MNHFSVKKKGFSVKRGEAIQWIRGLVRISTGKAIQWRGLGHSLNRRTTKTEKLLFSSPSQKSALTILWKVHSKRESQKCFDYVQWLQFTRGEGACRTGKSHPRTNTSLGGNFWRTSSSIRVSLATRQMGPLARRNFPWHSHQPMAPRNLSESSGLDLGDLQKGRKNVRLINL